MTKEDRDLLCKDIPARLYYGVKIAWDEKYPITLTPSIYAFIWGKLDFRWKPFLRSLSSITDEEKKEYQAFFNYDGIEYPEEYIDWLNAHYFDYIGLIDKGLALEAKEGMYNINNK